MISTSETSSQGPSVSIPGVRYRGWTKYDANMAPLVLRQRPYRLYIRERIALTPFNHEQIAERMGCAPGTVSKLLSGTMKMKIKWLAAFAYALECEVADLFRDPAITSQEELLKGVPEEKVRGFVEFFLKMTAI